MIEFAAEGLGCLRFRGREKKMQCAFATNQSVFLHDG